MKLGKDELEKGDTSNIIYKLKYKSCDKIYVGRTEVFLLSEEMNIKTTLTWKRRRQADRRD